MYENGTNIGNTADCRECEQYERDNDELREACLSLDLENKRLRHEIAAVIHNIESNFGDAELATTESLIGQWRNALKKTLNK